MGFNIFDTFYIKRTSYYNAIREGEFWRSNLSFYPLHIRAQVESEEKVFNRNSFQESFDAFFISLSDFGRLTKNLCNENGPFRMHEISIAVQILCSLESQQLSKSEQNFKTFFFLSTVSQITNHRRTKNHNFFPFLSGLPFRIMAEIPFWIHDRPKWVSGISRHTTCQVVSIRKFANES